MLMVITLSYPNNIEKLKFYKDKKVLITGSSGLLGSHLFDLLCDSCQEIRLLVRTSTMKYKEGVSVLYGDIRRSTVVNKIIEDVDLIFHLASLVNVDKSINNPIHTIDINVMGIVQLLEAVRKTENMPRIVFSSSADVYGDPKENVITEDHALNPSNPYSASKAAADMICQAYIKTYDMPITILRPSSLYGPRQRKTQFIPTVILQCLSRNILHLGPLDVYRDFCYVKDVAFAFALAGAINESKGQTFNITTEQPTNIADIVHKISMLLDKDVKIVKKKEFHRPKVAFHPFIISSLKAKEILRWVPRYDLDSGLKETIKWFRQFG